MGTVDERAAENPQCPKCRGAEVNKLNRLGTVQRWQCGRPSCLNEFDIPLSTQEIVQRAIEERGRPAAAERPSEEDVMEKVRGMKIACGKCGKPFNSPAWKEKHEAKCQGKASPATRPAKRVLVLDPKPPTGGPVGTLRAALAELREKRAWHLSQAEELEAAAGGLQTLVERLESAGATGRGGA